MKLRLFKHLEQDLGLRAHDGTRLPRMSITRHYKDATSMTVDTHQIVDYRIRVGARVRLRGHSDEEFTESHRRICKLLGREMFGDMVEELIALEEFAYTEGYDDAIQQRIQRLIKLAAGEEVDG